MYRVESGVGILVTGFGRQFLAQRVVEGFFEKMSKYKSFARCTVKVTKGDALLERSALGADLITLLEADDNDEPASLATLQ